MSIHMLRDIEKLKRMILKLGAEVESALEKTMRALKNWDSDLAQEVIDHDHEIDKMEVEIEEEGLKILALYHPVAIDLRFVIAVLKINNDLERIADQAVNTAQRTSSLTNAERIQIPGELFQMIDHASSMMKRGLDALVNMDPETARDVIADDDELDSLNRWMYNFLKGKIAEQPGRVQNYLNLLSVSHQLERTADLITNIAEDVIYMVEGEIVRHQKG